MTYTNMSTSKCYHNTLTIVTVGVTIGIAGVNRYNWHATTSIVKK